MTDPPPQTSERDPQRTLSLLLGELEARAGSEDVRLLWVRYVEAYLELNEISVISASNLDGITNEIIGSIQSSDLALVPDAQALAMDVLKTRADGRPYIFDPTQRSTSVGADPVLLFSGQFMHEVNDLTIDGAGITFSFQRTYRSQAEHAGPLGFNWDHVYNIRLRVVGETVLLSRGTQGTALYARHPRFGQSGSNFWIPPDGIHAVLLETATSFVLRMADGTRQFFEPDPTASQEHRLARTEDKHGNFLSFHYRDVTDSVLSHIAVNRSDRLVSFAYDAVGRITSISDYVNRIWTYRYDDFGDLTSVTTPSTTDFPLGNTIRYEYSSISASGDLAHNLIQIIDATGRAYVENEYGTDRGSLAFNRVVRQRLGDGLYQFEYANAVDDFASEHSDMDRPVHLTTVIDRNGHPTVNVFNRFGNLILKQERTLLDGNFVTIESRYRYNADGALIAQQSAGGRITQYYFGRDHYMRVRGIASLDAWSYDAITEVDRLSFGNQLATVQRGVLLDAVAQIATWGDSFPDIMLTSASDIVLKTTYEPNYQQVLTVSDPRHTLSADPQYPDNTRYQETLTRYEYVDGGASGYPLPTGRPQPNTSNLYLQCIRRPDATASDGTRVGGHMTQFIRYDAHGRALETLDAAGVTFLAQYFGPSSGVREGYLRSETIDPGGLELTTAFEVNEVGIVTAVIKPKAKGLTAGPYIARYEINELDQRVTTIRSEPFLFATRTTYDANGNALRDERDLLDENSVAILGGLEVRTYAYDTESNVVRQSVGGRDIAAHVVTTHHYDASSRLTRTVSPRGSQTWFRYDERSLHVATIRGACSDIAATTTKRYDEDGLAVVLIDARGSVTRQFFDSFGRLVMTVDPNGHRICLTYDKCGNLLVRRHLSRQEDGGYTLHARSEFTYDELNRRIIEAHNLFTFEPPVSDPSSNFLASGPGTLVATHLFYDRLDRVIRLLNSESQERSTEYDAAGRVISETDAVGDITQTTYDLHGNVVRRDKHDRVIDPDTRRVIGTEIFSTFHEYDELDRLIATIDPLGNETRFEYDSRDNVVRRIDPLGNVINYVYDVLNRRTAQQIELTDTGLGDGTLLATLTTQYGYDEDNNVSAVTDGAGNVKSYHYDSLNRRTTTFRPDGTVETLSYDAEDNLLRYGAGNGVVQHYRYDLMNRCERIDIDDSTSATGGIPETATFEAFQYDASGRAIGNSNDFVTVKRRFDSLGRIVDELDAIHVSIPSLTLSGTYSILRSFDTVGNLTTLTYPNGRMLRRYMDALNQTRRIENIKRGANYPGDVAGLDQHDIATFSYRGKRRFVSQFANDTIVSHVYDAGGRLLEVRHKAANGSTMLAVQHLFDGASNLRIKNETGTERTGYERYTYNSAYWHTRIDAHPHAFPLGSLDPFAPVSSLPAAATSKVQSRIDSVIGDLVDSQNNYTFAYDPVGNRIEERRPGQPGLLYTTNSENQYTSVGSSQLTYDLNGNLSDDGDLRYHYDYRNLIVKVTSVVTGKDVARFIYDAQRRRVIADTDDGIIVSIFDENNLIEEYRGGNLWAQYVYDVALDSIVQMACQGKDLWLHRDLTSVRLLSDRSGATVGAYRYDCFGHIIQQPTFYSRFSYQCRPYDAIIGSYDFRHRQYLPLLGRFLQRDTVEAPNQYIFVDNNPANGVDPLGMDRQLRLAELSVENVPFLMRKDPEACMQSLGSNSCAQTYATYQDWYQKQLYDDERRNAMIFELIQLSAQPGFTIGAFIPFMAGAGLNAQMASGSVVAAGFSFGQTGGFRMNSASNRLIFENIWVPRLQMEAQSFRDSIIKSRTDSRLRSKRAVDEDARRGASPTMVPKNEPPSGTVIIDTSNGKVYQGIGAFYGSGVLMPRRADAGLLGRYQLALKAKLVPDRDPFNCGEMMAQNRALLDGAKPGNLMMMSFGVPEYKKDVAIPLGQNFTPWPLCPNCKLTVDPDITVIGPVD